MKEIKIKVPDVAHIVISGPTQCGKSIVMDTITQYFESQGYSHRKAVQTAAMYGCTPKSPKHFGKNVVGIEIQGKYDGVSYWKCTECETVFDRWTMEVVEDAYDNA